MRDPKQPAVTTKEQERQEERDALLIQELEELLADKEDYRLG